MQRASTCIHPDTTCIHLVAEEETEIEKEIYQETEPGLRLNVQRAGCADKLELGGESPLTMRHGHWRSSNILWAPRPELRRLYRIDHHRKNEPGVPKGWEDYHTGEGSHCPWGHPHKFQFSALAMDAAFLWDPALTFRGRQIIICMEI